MTGTIQYSHTAFHWEEQAYTRYSSLMRVLTTAMAQSEAGRRLQWPDECTEACHELHKHIANQPLAHWSPHSILTALTCLIAMTDASDDAVAISLFVVKQSDARNVTKEHLKDPNMATLLSIKSAMLNEG